MHSDRPKVLHPLCGRAIASHVLHALAQSGVCHAVVIVPAGSVGDEIRTETVADAPDALELTFATQPLPLGTADAALCARPYVHDAEEILVINGDLALVSPGQLIPLLRAERRAANVLTAVVDDPARMGRIVRGHENQLRAIVEWREATEEQRQLREVNVGVYRFEGEFLWRALTRLPSRCEDVPERYVTDAVAVAAELGVAHAVSVPLPDGRLNVENLSDAADAEAALRRRICRRLLADGVRIVDPAAVWIDARAQIEQGVVIEPGSHIRGRTAIASRTRIGPAAVLEDSTAGESCVLESCTVRGSTLANHVEVGPYSTIRPGCELGEHVHIGTHAELKNARLGAGVQVGHFSYLGDCDVGARTNIGAGAITCNFDGAIKHQTRIGEDAFIGSDTMLVAPINVGARARTGAGSVVTKDVSPDANVVGSPARATPAGRAKRQRGQTGSEASR